jgi:hypothetical protein
MRQMHLQSNMQCHSTPQNDGEQDPRDHPHDILSTYGLRLYQANMRQRLVYVYVYVYIYMYIYMYVCLDSVPA